jgi:outer membrane immunogenic protein
LSAATITPRSAKSSHKAGQKPWTHCRIGGLPPAASRRRDDRGGHAQFNEKIDAFGTVRGRVGYAANNWLFNGTGGFAWSDETFTRTQLSEAPNSPFALIPVGDVRTNSPTRTGWAAGGGIGYGFARNWTARLEYLHLDLGDQSFRFAVPGNFRLIDEGRLTVDSVRVGVSYLFN